MTKLRSDGEFETSDHVVASCFIGKHIKAQRAGDDEYVDAILLYVGETLVYALVGGKVVTLFYPILIHASVVAEVSYRDDGKPSHAWVVITEYIESDAVDPIGDWLRDCTDTGGRKDG